MPLNSSDALFQQYGKKFVDAQEVIPELWGFKCDDIKTITTLIRRDKLNGLRPKRVGSKYLIDIDDLADVLDRI